MATWADVKKYIPTPAQHNDGEQWIYTIRPEDEYKDIPGVGKVHFAVGNNNGVIAAYLQQGDGYVALEEGQGGSIAGMPVQEDKGNPLTTMIGDVARDPKFWSVIGGGLAANAGLFGDLGGISSGSTSYAAPEAVGGWSGLGGSGITDEMLLTGQSGLGGLGVGEGVNAGWLAGIDSTAAIGGAAAAGAGTVAKTAGTAAAGTAAGKMSGLGTLGTLGALGATAGLAAGAGDLLKGETSTTVKNEVPGMSQEERDLINLNKKLAQSQLDNIANLQPFQQSLMDAALEELNRTKAYNTAMDAAVSPEQYAAEAKLEFERNQRLGPIQEELLQKQMDLLNQGTRATPEQIADIKAATDAGILSASGDIDVQTQRGIGLIADELANSRGLRLTDTPIAREATLLTRSGEDQKAGIIRSLRADEATARLNYPLAVTQLQSNINTNQQQINNAAKQFQEELRQRAYQNRLSLTGQAQSGGIGLSSIGAGSGVLSGLTNARLAGSTSSQTSSNPAAGVQGLGNLLSGAGGLVRGLA